MDHDETPGQTIGPFFSYGLTPEQYGFSTASLAGPNLTDEETQGERIRLEGCVFDGAGAPVTDAMIEIWQADGEGRYAHPADSRASNANFTGFGRTGTGTDDKARFWFNTIKPGAPTAGEAPHINVVIFMRGLIKQTYTRIYFADEAKANALDPVLTLVPKDRRQTLLAHRADGPTGPIYRFDIHMQGGEETVFFQL
ncbi:MAG: protocatechuate 3,4-dioxygenase subunit alpha [Chromatiales bacterium]|jgi:protocatechuate 3,4-dioxygenase, alpha subunit|nr:protocatechuate 3,4-dioxygenase subunit alpha [Chromatiales bacterium]